tara:strand:+ start:384 stop:863 length:480 start_codon:yes stop_codon:yes gene_type:complete
MASYGVMMKRNFWCVVVPVCLILAAGSLTEGADKQGGFRFPGGDSEAGAEAFVLLSCVQCHTVKGIKLDEPKGKWRLQLQLAAELRFVKDYEDLITAIMSPKHVVAEQYRAILSPAERNGEIEAFMPDLSNDMSARQLMDIVAFLDGVYRAGLKGYSSK